MTKHTLLSLLFALTTLVFGPSLGAVTITSITPATGPTEGGTAVTIHGTDFAICAICSPPFPVRVYFDDIPALTVLADANTIEAVAPPHLPGTAYVWVEQYNGHAASEHPYTYTGGVPHDAFERILLPVLTPPVRGSFGSLFQTEMRIEHKQDAGDGQVRVYGLRAVCYFDPCIGITDHVGIEPGYPIDSSGVELSGTPGRFVYVPRSEVGSMAANLRVFDATRTGLNFGTEMPIVRENELVNDRVVFVGVPADPRFRNTLRIYAEFPVDVLVTVGEHPAVRVALTGGTDIFDPAYAVFSEFPAGTMPVRVTVKTDPDHVEPPNRIPIWAFITVTNNETQAITTVTPRP